MLNDVNILGLKDIAYHLNFSGIAKNEAFILL
jgi:hypothetical protein